MLFIFRKLRKSFFLPGKARTYLAYAVGEIVLIVVGILIAVEIGDRNQARKDRAEETRILTRLKSDFEENRSRLLENENTYQDISASLREFLEIISPKPESHSNEAILAYLDRLAIVPLYTPNTGTLDSLIASGKIVLIQNESLNDLLSSWPSLMENYHRSIKWMTDEYLINWDTFSEHFQLRDVQVEVGNKGHTGQSNFSYDQRTLLSQPELEDLTEQKRINSEELLIKIESLTARQQSILDLIDAELKERGTEP